MKILVQKFGGTSVADLECQKKVLAKVKRGLDNGYKVVAVLSARHGDTNNLLALAREWSAQPDPAECDSLVSTGEQVSISLFTMLLKDNGIKARSLLAWQIPLITDDSFGSARIESIDGEAIRKLFLSPALHLTRIRPVSPCTACPTNRVLPLLSSAPFRKLAFSWT